MKKINSLSHYAEIKRNTFGRQTSSNARGKGFRSLIGISLRSGALKISEASAFARRRAPPISKLPTIVVILVVFSASTYTARPVDRAFKRNITGASKTNENAGRYYRRHRCLPLQQLALGKRKIFSGRLEER